MKTTTKILKIISITAFIGISTALCFILQASPGLTADNSLVSRLQSATGNKAKISYHSNTGMVRFFGTDLAHPLATKASLSKSVSPEAAARSFLGEFGGMFGLRDQASELTVMRSTSAPGQRSFVRFQQRHQGVPIFGGELIVQTDTNLRIISANGEILPGLALDILPTIKAPDAADSAREAVAKWYQLNPADVVVSSPELWIYNPILLGPGRDVSALVWRMDVTVVDRPDIKELVLVDAQLGAIALHFNQVPNALNRSIYNNNNVRSDSLPGTGPVRTEGQAATGITDVDNAYDFAGDVYNFYFTYHGRDSIDGAGMQLIHTVKFCYVSTLNSCPYANAFWNGSQMVYGDGYSSGEDVVGHEMTHGVTEHESRLYYYMQSGAINEAFSDVWGELIELTYHPGAASERWLLGENLPIGAIRDMKNPPSFSDPDKMTSSYYLCQRATGTDIGGVHTNSGVCNKTAYLLTDGDTFNGRTVTGLGIEKVADLYYEVQTNLFTSASDYEDLYDCLQQAAVNLGWSVSDQQQVKNACDATEMNLHPAACPANDAPVCDAGTPVNIFYDDLENTSSGNWTRGAVSGSADEWYYPQNSHPYDFDATYATSGATNFWGYDREGVADYVIAMTHDVAIPAGAYLHFSHSYSFEFSSSTYWDGGVVEYSTNGGSAWSDAGPLFTENGYNCTITNTSSNPLGGRQGFGDESYGYISSRLDLSSLSGQNVRFRFRIGTDLYGDDYGWYIDDIQI